MTNVMHDNSSWMGCSAALAHLSPGPVQSGCLESGCLQSDLVKAGSCQNRRHLPSVEACKCQPLYVCIEPDSSHLAEHINMVSGEDLFSGVNACCPCCQE